ncbi:NAD(P)H-dependent oxidoreductase [Aliifodinibius salicampi]|uniref:NAD(P)H-dependent oxidoreductase n=1 Tax=Fodinibius salicampi TaxID=1920655 RepID=A0ABT3Q2K7_9BACT|nr:NAD(P)H-dependent oxidoreductase [Fodinibius salicampi]MCW9714344.1 NAD(P)H-dependent oxidoreductase [Fodinibius salicampi]
MSDLLGIVGSVSTPSKTRAAIEISLQAAENEFDVNTEILHLAEYDLDIADGRKLDEYTGDTADALNLIINSSAFLIGTPVYRGSYSGALKNLFDLIPRGQWQSDEAPLEDRPIGLIATGATDHHYLSISHELEPIASFFGSHQVGSGVYVNSSQFDDHQVTDKEIIARLETLGKATIELSKAVDNAQYLSQLGPQF